MVRAYLGLGSNLGDRKAYLQFALEALGKLQGTSLSATSRLYCSKPWGNLDQPDFMNMVAEVDTSLEPEQLLAACQQIERQAGRTAGERWGPRVLDIDMLLYNTHRVVQPGLEVPHPRMLERRFVIEPLIELQPRREALWFLPDHVTLQELLEAEAIRSQEVWPCGGFKGKGVDDDG